MANGFSTVFPANIRMGMWYAVRWQEKFQEYLQKQTKFACPLIPIDILSIHETNIVEGENYSSLITIRTVGGFVYRVSVYEMESIWIVKQAIVSFYLVNLSVEGKITVPSAKNTITFESPELFNFDLLANIDA